MRTNKFLSEISICHLFCFVVACERGSFRKAAVALNRNQSAVSRQIVDLEDTIGASLFHRHSWGVSLTYAGERFLRRARLIVRSVGDGAADIAAIGRPKLAASKSDYFHL